MRHALCLTALLVLPATQSPAQTPGAPWPDGAANRPQIQPAFPAQRRAPAQLTDPAPVLSKIADGLDTPWAIEVLPNDAGYLVTERGGDLRHVSRNGRVSAPINGVPEVVAERQGGLLDLALAPDFADSRVLYLTLAAPRALANPPPPQSARPSRPT